MSNAQACRRRYKKRKNKGLCVTCGKYPAIDGKVACGQCSEKHRRYCSENHDKLRHEIFMAYGGYQCACCGEIKHPAFMHIDHINGGGNEHRRQIGGHSGGKFYRWLKKNNFPEGFQVLCADCNTAKGYFGECPHINDKSPRLINMTDKFQIYKNGVKDLF